MRLHETDLSQADAGFPAGLFRTCNLSNQLSGRKERILMNPLARLKASNFSISCRVWASLLFEIAKSAIRQYRS
jgi:hypothetical protein